MTQARWPWYGLVVCGLAAVGLWVSTLSEDRSRAEASRALPPGSLRIVGESPLQSGSEPPVGDRQHPTPSTKRVEATVQDTGPTAAVPRTSIRVVDTHAQPLADAQLFEREAFVVLRDSTTQQWPAPLPTPLGVSDADGRIDAPLPAEASRYCVYAVGHRPERLVLAPDELDREVRLTRNTGARLAITSEDGEPVAGARVLVQADGLGWIADSSGAGFAEVGRADEGGRLTIPQLRVSALAVRVAADGFALARATIPYEADEVRLVLVAEATASGIVQGAAAVTEPLFVIAERPEVRDGEQDPALVAAAATPEGAFRFRGLASGAEYVFTPCLRRAERWTPVGPPQLVRLPDDRIELAVGDAVSLSVRALDAEGRPLVPSVVVSRIPREVLAGPESPTLEVAPDGTCRWPALFWDFGGLPRSSARTLWLEAEGHATAELGQHVLEPGAHLDLGTVALRSSLAKSLRVVDARNQRALEAAWARFVPARALDTLEFENPWIQEATADDEGRIYLNWAPGLSGVVEVGCEGWIPQKHTWPSGRADEDVFHLERPALVSLRCLTLDQTPAGSASVQWASPGSQPLEWNDLIADRAGRASFHVAPGDVIVRFSPGSLRGRFPGGGTTKLDVHRRADGEPQASQVVEIAGLRSGEHREVTLDFPVMGPLRVAATLDGRPAAGFRVIAVPGTTVDVVLNDLWGSFDLPKDVTDENGHCALLGVPTGKVMLCAVDPSSNFAWFTVIRAERTIPVAVDLPMDSKRVRVTVVDSSGAPQPSIDVALTQLSAQDGVRAPQMIFTTPGGTERTVGRPRRARVGTTDASGQVGFDLAPREGLFEVAVLDREAGPLLAPVRVSSTAPDVHVEIRGGTSAALELYVKDESGADYAHLPIVLRQGSLLGKRLEVSETDADGRVLFGGLEPGRYAVQVPSGDGAEFSVEAGEVRTEVASLR